MDEIGWDDDFNDYDDDEFYAAMDEQREYEYLYEGEPQDLMDFLEGSARLRSELLNGDDLPF